jgi:hypothetical protein
MEEIEEFYKEEIEKADSEYLKKLENKLERKQAEEDYREKLKKIREQYSKKYKGYFLEERKKIRKKELKKSKDNFKRLKVEKFDFSFNFTERLRIKKAIETFRLKRKLRKFFYKITPEKLIYVSIKFRKKQKRFFDWVRKVSEKTFERLKEKTIRLFELVIGLSKKILNKTTGIIKKVLGIIWEVKKENKDEVKEAEKPEEKKEESTEEVKNE